MDRHSYVRCPRVKDRIREQVELGPISKWVYPRLSNIGYWRGGDNKFKRAYRRMMAFECRKDRKGYSYTSSVYRPDIRPYIGVNWRQYHV